MRGGPLSSGGIGWKPTPAEMGYRGPRPLLGVWGQVPTAYMNGRAGTPAPLAMASAAFRDALAEQVHAVGAPDEDPCVT